MKTPQQVERAAFALSRLRKSGAALDALDRGLPFAVVPEPGPTRAKAQYFQAHVGAGVGLHRKIEATICLSPDRVERIQKIVREEFDADVERAKSELDKLGVDAPRP